MFGNRSFNVKVVKDKPETDPSDPMQGVLVAQAYAEVVKNTVWDLAGTVATVIVLKTICDIAKIVVKNTTS